ncbi:GatB/YqeY domain-containing protein [Alphaproteobacteria bacterium]|nr:GatB/YqeY domain-containing protein [Alphaproteobacteria bacterium]
MSIRDEITNKLKEAMIRKDGDLLNTLRLIKASIKEKDIIAKGNGKTDISDQEIISVLQSMIKQRKVSVEMYLNGKRDDLAKKEENEIKIISKFLPEQLSVKQIEIIINETIISSSANSLRDIGKIINLMKEKYDGKIDFGVASKMIKEKLSQI